MADSTCVFTDEHIKLPCNLASHLAGATLHSSQVIKTTSFFKKYLPPVKVLSVSQFNNRALHSSDIPAYCLDCHRVAEGLMSCEVILAPGLFFYVFHHSISCSAHTSMKGKMACFYPALVQVTYRQTIQHKTFPLAQRT